MNVFSFEVIATIQGYLPMVPFLLALYRWKSLSRVSRVAAVYLFSCSFTHVVAECIFSFKIIKNGFNVVGNTFNFVEIAFLLFIFHLGFRSPKVSRTLIAVMVVFFIAAVLNILFLQPLSVINSNTMVLTNVLLMVISVAYFFSLLHDMPTQNLTRFPMFWIATAILTYSSGSFVTYVVTEYLVVLMPEEFLYVWSFKNILRVVYYLLIGWGILIDNTRNPGLA